MDSTKVALEGRVIAGDAKLIALEAKHAADMNAAGLVAHEDLCLVRYGNIDRQLRENNESISRQLDEINTRQKEMNGTHVSAIDKIYTTLGELKTASTLSSGKATGAEMFFKYTCLFIATAVALAALYK